MELEKYKQLEKAILQDLSQKSEKNYFSANFSEHDVAEEIITHFLKQSKNDGLVLKYQPKVHRSGKVNVVEVLSRYKIGDIYIHPQVLFALIRQKGLEREILYRQIDMVCKAMPQFIKDFGNDFCASINVNPQLFDKDFCDYYLQKINEYGLSAKNIAVELLESSNFCSVREQDIERLQQAGAQINLDDYDTGYATQEVMKKYNFDVIKIAGEKISNIDTDIQKQNFVLQTVKYAKQTKKQVVAERVETKQELKFLFDAGVDFIQGYIFSPAISAEELIEKYGKVANQDENITNII